MATSAGRAGVPPMRHVLEIQYLPTAKDDYGGETKAPDWATEHTCRGAIKPLQGRERWTAQQVQADVTHEITIRFYAGLSAKKRIKDQDTGRIFNIVDWITPDEVKHLQVITAVEEEKEEEEEAS